MIPIGTENQMVDALNRHKVNTQMKCIQGALKLLLDREPTIDDAKLCSQVFPEKQDGTFRLFYNKIEVGTVRTIDTADKFRVEFVPIQKLN